MTREHIEFVLSEYSTLDAIADKLLELFDEEAASYQHTINELNKALSENQGEWIPVKYHMITDEERAREGYPREWVYLIDCKMPYDGQQILTTTKGGFVELDECYYDGYEYSLDSDRDWADDVIAWMPKPEPYKAEN